MENNDKGIVKISRDEATKLVDNTSNELVSKILAENDSKQIKDLTSLFNLNIKKKNVLRLLKLNDLLDNVNDTVIERVNKRSDELTMKEVIDILTTTQSIIEKTNKTIETTKDGRKNLETGAKLPTTIMLLVLISVVIFKNKLSKKSLFKRL